MKQFVSIFDTAKTKVLIMDKDFNEIHAAKKVMPHIQVQLCEFHVMQAFQREVK